MAGKFCLSHMSILCFVLQASFVRAVEREWLMNQRLVGTYPEQVEGVMFLEVEGNILIYGGILSRNYVDELYMWNPGAKVIRNIGSGPTGFGLSDMRGLSPKTVFYIRWASTGSKVLMVFLPSFQDNILDSPAPWPNLSAHLLDISGSGEWTNVGTDGVGTGDSPGGLYAFALAGANGKFYIFGGRSFERSYNDQLHEFNPSTLAWQVVETQGAPKIPLMLVRELIHGWAFKMQYTPPDEPRRINDLTGEGGNHTHGATHSMTFHNGKLYFSNSSDIYQLDLTTWTWTLDEHIVTGRRFSDGVLLSCGGELLHATCRDDMGDNGGRVVEMFLDEIVPREPGETVTCQDGEDGEDVDCRTPLSRLGSSNPTAACFQQQVFCSGNGNNEGELLGGHTPTSIELTTRNRVPHPFAYAAVYTHHPSFAGDHFADPLSAQLLGTVIDTPGSAIWLTVMNEIEGDEWSRFPAGVYAANLLDTTVATRWIKVENQTDPLKQVEAIGDAVVACGERKVWRLKREMVTPLERRDSCVSYLFDGDCQQCFDYYTMEDWCQPVEHVANFTTIWDEQKGDGAPPACELLAVHEGAFVLFNDGTLYRGTVDGSAVSWAEDGEYEALDIAEGQTKWSDNRLVSSTGQYMMVWGPSGPTDEWTPATVPGDSMNGSLFDLAARKWLPVSDFPAVFSPAGGGGGQTVQILADMVGFDGKFYFWTQTEENFYIKIGADKYARYDPATDIWEDLTGVWVLPDTLGDTEGGLARPTIDMMVADGSLLVLDKVQGEERNNVQKKVATFDVFRVPIPSSVPSSGNLWADLASAFDGDTICLAPTTTLNTPVRFGTGSFPSRIAISDCSVQPARRHGPGRRAGSVQGASELMLQPGALMVCYDTDGCSYVALSNLAVSCSGQTSPSAMQVLGRGASLSLTDVTVRGCAAEGDGGGLLVDNGVVRVERSRFEDLSAAGSGGALYVRGGQVQIEGSEFVGCSAQVGGALEAVPLGDTVVGPAGAAFVTFDPNITLSDSTFSRNTARAGGAVHTTSSSLEVRGCAFEANNASRQTGGALHLVDSHVRIAETRFEDNAAQWGGGAVFWQTLAPQFDVDDICAAGGNQAAWGSCKASNAQEIVVSVQQATLYTGVTLEPMTVQMRDFYGQTLTTESEATFDVVASLNFTLAADPDVQVTGTLIQQAQQGATTFNNINVQVRFSQWDLATKQTALVSEPLLYFTSVDPYSGAALTSDIVPLTVNEGDAVCPLGSILEVNDERSDGEGGSSTMRGRCVQCAVGTYSLSPLSSPSAGATRPACFPCPAGAGDACAGGAVFNISAEGQVWGVEGPAWRLQECAEGYIMVRDEDNAEQDQCVECAAPTFSRGAVVYEAGAPKVALRAVDAAALCSECPPNADCNGGTTVVPRVGFWSIDGSYSPPEAGRRADQAEELEMYKCPSGACPTGANQCAPGHRDRVCAICEEKHARTPAGCLKCEGDVGALKAVAGVFGTIAFLILWYWFAWRPMLEDVSVFQMMEQGIQKVLSCWFSAQDQRGEAEEKVGMVATGLGWISSIYQRFKGDLQGFLKIIISFYQVVSSFATTFTVDWPKGLVRLFDGAKFFQLDFISLPGPACLTFDWSYSAKLVVYTVVPLIVVLLIGLPVTIAFFAARSAGGFSEYPKWDKTTSLFWYSLLFFLYIIYPMVSVQCLSTFSCHDLGPAGNWLVADYRVSCPVDDSAGFLFGWSIFFTLVYPAGIPLFFAGIMYYFRIPTMAKQKLDGERVQKTIDLYRRETGSTEGASLVRHIESVAMREGAEGDMMVGMQKVFETIDADGNGVLSLEELKGYMLREGLCTEAEFKLALPLKRVFKRCAKGNKLVLEALVDMCDELDKSYSSFTGRDIPANLSLDEHPLSRLSRGQLELLANHPWDFTEEEGPDVSRETILRNMAEGGDGRRSSEEDADAEEEEEAAEEEKGPPLTRRELEEKVQGIAEELESFGKVVLPALGWDGGLEGEQEALDRIGFLFTMYEVKYWYFELVEMVRKLLVTAVLVFVFPRTPAQLAAGLVISFGSLIIYYSCRPFLSERLDGLQIFALITQCINLFYGIMLIVQEATAGTTGNSQEDGLITGIVVLLNCIIVAVPFVNMATERGLSVSSVAAFVPCCRKEDGAEARDQEEGVEGEQHTYGRFRGSSIYSDGASLHHRRAHSRAKLSREAEAEEEGAVGRSETQAPLVQGGAPGSPQAGGEPALELSSRPEEPAAHGPAEIQVTLAEPVVPRRRSAEQPEGGDKEWSPEGLA